MEHESVTIICIYCKRTVDGYFDMPDKTKIISIQTSKVLAVPGEWNKKKGYMHPACLNGIKAEQELGK